MEAEKAQVICTATIVTEDGESRTARAEFMKGSPEDPLSMVELRDKFRANAAAQIPDDQTERALDILDRLHECKDVSALTSLLSG